MNDNAPTSAITKQLSLAALDATAMPMCILDCTYQIVFTNRAWCDFYPQKAGDPDPGTKNWGTCGVGDSYLDLFPAATVVNDSHQDIRNAMADGLQAVMQGQELFSIEFPCPCITAYNPPTWLRASVTRCETPDLHLAQLHLVVMHQNITNHKFAELLYWHSDAAMVVTDAANTIIAINPAYTRLTGYTEADVLGKNPHINSSGRHDKAFYTAMWQSLNSSGSWQGEIWNRRKNGEEFAEWISINAVGHVAGQTDFYIALFSDITEKKRSSELMWKQANFDPLTGLPNRRLMQDRLDVELKKAQRTKLWVVVFFIDLDHFKEVNDTLGHAAGDLLLIEASHRLNMSVREADTVARLGGDEFTVILSDINDYASVERIAQAILQALAAPYQLANEIAHLSGSIGISAYPTDATNSEDLLKKADQAMYIAKRQGRNRYQYFNHLKLPDE